MTECPHCGQAMLIRFDVKFPPKKADILDMIEKITKGRGGIPMEQLIWIFYPGTPKKNAVECIRSHICQINDMLAATDWRIVHEAGLYKLKEVVGA